MSEEKSGLEFSEGRIAASLASAAHDVGRSAAAGGSAIAAEAAARPSVNAVLESAIDSGVPRRALLFAGDLEFLTGKPYARLFDA
jgi:hypothetical protein